MLSDRNSGLLDSIGLLHERTFPESRDSQCSLGLGSDGVDFGAKVIQKASSAKLNDFLSDYSGKHHASTFCQAL